MGRSNDSAVLWKVRRCHPHSFSPEQSRTSLVAGWSCFNLSLAWEATCLDPNVRSKLAHWKPGPCRSLTRDHLREERQRQSCLRRDSHGARNRWLLKIVTDWWTLSVPSTSGGGGVRWGRVLVPAQGCLRVVFSSLHRIYVIGWGKPKCLQMWDSQERCLLSLTVPARDVWQWAIMIDIDTVSLPGRGCSRACLKSILQVLIRHWYQRRDQYYRCLCRAARHLMSTVRPVKASVVHSVVVHWTFTVTNKK